MTNPCSVSFGNLNHFINIESLGFGIFPCKLKIREIKISDKVKVVLYIYNMLY